MQEQRQPPKSCVSSSFNLHAGVSNNTKEAVAISICRGRLSSPYGLDQSPSTTRIAAGAFGFLTLIQVFDGPERFGASIFFETMPSRPSLQAALTLKALFEIQEYAQNECHYPDE
jgi:hypothetical protein